MILGLIKPELKHTDDVGIQNLCVVFLMPFPTLEWHSAQRIRPPRPNSPI